MNKIKFSTLTFWGKSTGFNKRLYHAISKYPKQFGTKTSNWEVAYGLIQV